MLNFVALAQNFWPWATYNSEKHSNFINKITEYVGRLIPLQESTKMDVLIGNCFQTKIAAIIAEVLVMYLFHSRQTGNKLSATDLLKNNISYFTRFAAAKSSYATFHGMCQPRYMLSFALGLTVLPNGALSISLFTLALIL
jgi:nuclear pore complex protein Nup188